LLVAIVAQVFILSLGIGEKMSSLRKEKDNAKEKAMLQLEGKVTERTKELNEKKNILEIKNKEINDSINYAKRIQNAILPSTELIDESFSDKFILYLPKDIVAGDFYWLEKTSKSTLLAVADCTGHGVPGAMVSVVCYNALNKSVKEFNLTNPAQILDKTRELVIETFSKNSLGIKDGMDISLINYNSESKKLFYSGANNHLLIIRNNELLEYRADKQPVGMAESYTPFSNHEIDLIKNDVIYLYTDGYADQFGGENDKKLKSANFKKLLLKNIELEMEDQRIELLTFFNNWKNQTEQLDDVCVIGIKV
jgi:serine phosphatase RsbU (regulator of sigma subunit)